MDVFTPRFEITQRLAYKEYKQDLMLKETGGFPGAQQYDVKVPFVKIKDFKIPKQKRTSNDPPVKNDSVSPQTYDVLSGHGYVDIKNLELMSKLSRRGE